MAGAPLRIEVVCARPGRAWRLALQLPADLNPRTRALAAQ